MIVTMLLWGIIQLISWEPVFVGCGFFAYSWGYKFVDASFSVSIGKINL